MLSISSDQRLKGPSNKKNRSMFERLLQNPVKQDGVFCKNCNGFKPSTIVSKYG